MRFQQIRPALAAAVLAASLAACQAATTATNEFTGPGAGLAATQAELRAEASAFGTAQAATGAAIALDPTGLSSIATLTAGRAAHRAWTASAHARLRAASEADLQEKYRRYGLNPDGTPSGKPGPGSAR